MTDSQPRNALQAPLVTDQPPASPASPESPAEPRPVGVPWTVRVAGWSARHRWPVFVLWFVATIGLFAGSLAAGGTNSAEAVSNNQRAKYEAGEAFIVYNEANAGAQQTEKASSSSSCSSSTTPTGTTDDPAFVSRARRHHDAARRADQRPSTATTGPVFEELVDPTPAPPAGRADLARQDDRPDRRPRPRRRRRPRSQRLEPVPAARRPSSRPTTRTYRIHAAEQHARERRDPAS